MNSSVFFCVGLAALMWGAGRVGLAYEIIVRPNVQTPDCPHGNVYMRECKKCFCKDNVNNSTVWPYPYCRKDKCIEWACPDPPSFKRECEGLCTCDVATAITTCEKYCVPKMQGIKNKLYQDEEEPDVTV